MKDLSTTEAYFLCAVQDKGKIFGYNDSKIACLMAAVLYELDESNLVEIDGDRLRIHRDGSVGAPYLAPVYEHLKELDSPKFKHVLQEYNSSWSDWHLNTLTAAIGAELAKRGLAVRAKLGLFNGRTYFMPRKDALPSLAAELLVNILYQTPIPAEDGFLWLLLEKSACIPNAFTQQQREDIHAKINAALQDSPDSRLAELSRYADRLLTLVKHYPI